MKRDVVVTDDRPFMFEDNAYLRCLSSDRRPLQTQGFEGSGLVFGAVDDITVKTTMKIPSPSVLSHASGEEPRVRHCLAF